MLSLAPTVTWASLFASTPARTPAVGAKRLTVGLLTGCVQRLVFPHVNAATVRVLAAEGCDVIAPADQGCCGALALHAGRLDEARAFARRTIEAFERAGVERIAVNAAGCGSSMKEYGQLLADDPAWADARAAVLGARARRHRNRRRSSARRGRRGIRFAMRVAYHDACHLAHAQGVRQPPRDLLRSIPGDRDPAVRRAGDLLRQRRHLQPRRARARRASSATARPAHIDAVRPDLIATANPGCTLQMAAAAARLGRSRPIRHPIEILDASIRGVELDTDVRCDRRSAWTGRLTRRHRSTRSCRIVSSRTTLSSVEDAIGSLKSHK